MDQFHIGKIKVSRVEEWSGGFSSADFLFAGYEEEEWRRREPEFVPDFYLPDEGRIFGVLQSWVLDTGRERILFDTGAGNDKDRPGIPIFGNLETDFLARLRAAGYEPGDIDTVVCSHLHIDHVGWNTTLVDDRWEPTFRNARYVLPTADRDYWDPQGEGQRPTEQGQYVNAGVFEDSVQPIIDASRAIWADDGFEVAEGLTLHSRPGHTPGQMAMEVRTPDQTAFFVGDILHHPMQVHRPDWNSRFCEDPEQAIASRRQTLEQVANSGALLVPAHFGGEHLVRVAREGSSFRPLYVRDVA
ncbi:MULTISPECIES: MBL fold metallo-hydrolase [Sphingomonas]|uniref:MBL fold metallo-hydrolase n=1 Tax=Sphingomonas TaxID=13687 RepID=UPI000DEEEA3F|nr:MULTISPECIES: MBL fold metallo-hydrolase [Sphingomonas]